MVMKDRAYNELYLKSNIELHRLLFLDFTKNKDFDFFHWLMLICKHQK